MKNPILGAGLAAIALFAMTGCTTDADVASKNISKAADSFEIQRRIVFYNGITGEVMLEVDGLCSLGNSDASGQLSVTCKTGPGTFKKHFLGLSDNVTYFVQQLEDASISTSRYRVIWKPSTLVPGIDLQ